ncbi:DUF5672 family protein [Aquabacterium sp.]|uniref:DUF5672 family protein n=1 Tax=Aquabacterium sp. TaxID=1872578 RepID=UPI0019B84FE1|nr:DUF5672 family protein [Aquabacterium sp.]MBC7700931.1 hypothetical protein [Aquabacterium sp.]
MRTVAVVVPIYQAQLSALEHFSLTHSLAQLQPGRTVVFIGPEGLDFSAYAADFPGIPLLTFDPSSFQSVQGYSRLLMSKAFYQRFDEHEFMLILQTDAILLRDELGAWCARPYDYVGAPWPDGLEILVNLGKFQGTLGKKIRTHVGNGGLSLRRIRKCIALLDEFPEAVDFFDRTGSSEDLFFGFMGPVSLDFVMPNEFTAATFSLELKPEYYHAVNQQRPPMGGHAWWKYNPAFWLDLLGPDGDAVRPLLP